jgi:hypothetical protein
MQCAGWGMPGRRALQEGCRSRRRSQAHNHRGCWDPKVSLLKHRLCLWACTDLGWPDFCFLSVQQGSWQHLPNRTLLHPADGVTFHVAVCRHTAVTVTHLHLDPVSLQTTVWLWGVDSTLQALLSTFVKWHYPWAKGARSLDCEYSMRWLGARVCES